MPRVTGSSVAGTSSSTAAWSGTRSATAVRIAPRLTRWSRARAVIPPPTAVLSSGVARPIPSGLRDEAGRRARRTRPRGRAGPRRGPAQPGAALSRGAGADAGVVQLPRAGDEYRKVFGVEPICRVLTSHGLKIATSTYYAAKNRAPSARSVRDDELRTQRSGLDGAVGQQTEIVRRHTPRRGHRRDDHLGHEAVRADVQSPMLTGDAASRRGVHSRGPGRERVCLVRKSRKVGHVAGAAVRVGVGTRLRYDGEVEADRSH